MNPATRPLGFVFKRLVLLFWTMFFTMVAVTNLVNIASALGIFDWTFLNSGNFAYLESVVAVYDIGSTLTKLALIGAFLIEALAAVLFWRALLSYGRQPWGKLAAFRALCWGTVVWTAFVFMTEFFVAYGSESVFRELLAIMIASAIAIALIPDEIEEHHQ